MTPFLLLHLWIGAETVSLPPDGLFNAPAGKCVRATGQGTFAVRVNDLAVGEVRDGGELDITGYLGAGKANKIDAGGAKVSLIVSPLVYLRSASFDGKLLRVEVVNTTVNTVQVELGNSHQFTVSPGTTGFKEFAVARAGRVIRMRATSDGLDQTYEDEIAVERRATSSREQSPDSVARAQGTKKANLPVAD